MNLRQLIPPECVILELKKSEDVDVIPEMIDYLIKIDRVSVESREVFLEAVLDREQQVGTGLGSGVAIPHARVNGIEDMIAVFARSTNGVNFESPDHAPSHCVVLLLAPDGKTAQYLQTLSELAKIFSQCECRKELMAAKNVQEISAIFSAGLSPIA